MDETKQKIKSLCSEIANKVSAISSVGTIISRTAENVYFTNRTGESISVPELIAQQEKAIELICKDIDQIKLLVNS